MTISEALSSARQSFAGTIEEPERTAASILAASVGRGREFLIAHPEYELSIEESKRFEDFVRRRLMHEPLQYILGRQEFYGLEFSVGPGVLIPRPETELLVQFAVEILKETAGPEILDLGVGSGCISVAVLKELPTAAVTAVDISPIALEYAGRNAAKHNVAGRIKFIESDLFDSVPVEHYNAILANPPYVSREEMTHLQPEVKDYEPGIALTDGSDGLSIIRRIIKFAPDYLVKGGFLIMEIGYGQAERVAELFVSDNRWTNVSFEKDLQGIERTVIAKVK